MFKKMIERAIDKKIDKYTNEYIEEKICEHYSIHSSLKEYWPRLVADKIFEGLEKNCISKFKHEGQEMAKEVAQRFINEGLKAVDEKMESRGFIQSLVGEINKCQLGDKS